MVSWLEMNKFSAEKYYRIGCLLGNTIQALEHLGKPGGVFRDLNEPNVCAWLELVSKYCREIGLIQSAKCTERITKELSTRETALRDIKSPLDGLQKLINSELEEELFFHVNAEYAKYHHQPFGFDRDGAKPSEAFPSTVSEIEEAGNCLALSRPTACVFHLMRALEPCLCVLSRELSVVKHSPTWHAYLSAFPDAIKANFPAKNAADGEMREFYSGVTERLTWIKDGWRNPTMHSIEATYTESQAVDIYNAVGAFMRHLATKLKE